MSKTARILIVSMIGLVAAAVVLFVTVRKHMLEPPLHGAMAEFSPAASPMPVPAVRITGDTAHPPDLTALHGRFVIVNFWASWCPPCLEELPSLLALKNVADKDSGLSVVTISEDHSPDSTVAAFLVRKGWQALGLDHDPDGELLRALNIPDLPTTLLLDPQGRELGRLVGPADWSGSDARDLIRWYRQQLGHPAPAPPPAR